MLGPEDGGGGAARVGVTLCLVFLALSFGLAALLTVVPAALGPPTVHDVLCGASSPEDSGVSLSLSSVRSTTSRPRRGGAVRNNVGDGDRAEPDAAGFFGVDAAAYNGDMKDTPLGAVATNLVSFFFTAADAVDEEVADGADVEETAACERGRAALDAGTEVVLVRGGAGGASDLEADLAGADAFLTRGSAGCCAGGGA